LSDLFIKRATSMSTIKPRTASAPGYGPVAKVLHWLITALLMIQYGLGWVMPEVHRNTKPDGLIAWHLGVGATIVAVVAVRLVWRLFHPVPLVSDAVAPWQNLLARITHWGLYLGLTLLLALGWANASARGWSVTLFRIVPLPAIMPSGARLGMQAGDVHSLVGWLFLALVGLHVVAALYHRLILRDQVMQRMLPE
jgi:cytochrome b561